MRLRLLLAIACGALLLAAPVAHAARGMEVAISDEDAMVTGQTGNPLVAYQAAQALNATRMRILVQWSRVSDANQSSPSANPDYNWGPIDNAVDAAALYGMRTQLALTGPAPNYAAGLYKNLRIVRPDPKLYANFVRAAAEHFKGRVDRYSIWNEPNYPAWIAPQSESPKIYRALYTAGYDAVKSVDPAAQVLIGETVPYGGTANGKRLGLATAPLKWLRAVACVDAQYKRVGNCTPLKADGYAHHPYEFTEAPTAKSFPGADNAPIQTLGRLRTALDKLARAHALSTPKGKALTIYLTESGYFVTGARKVAAAKRARWLPESFQVATQAGPGEGDAPIQRLCPQHVDVHDGAVHLGRLAAAGVQDAAELDEGRGQEAAHQAQQRADPAAGAAGRHAAPDPERHGHQRGRQHARRRLGAERRRWQHAPGRGRLDVGRRELLGRHERPAGGQHHAAEPRTADVQRHPDRSGLPPCLSVNPLRSCGL